MQLDARNCATQICNWKEIILVAALIAAAAFSVLRLISSALRLLNLWEE